MEVRNNNEIIEMKNNHFNKQINIICKECKLPAYLIIKNLDDIRINCPKNHEVKTSIEELEQLTKTNSSKNICPFCCKIYLLNELSFCKPCSKIICNECIKSHETDHKLEKIKLVEKICEIHQNICCYFCIECNTHICDFCIQNKHKSHKIINLIDSISNIEIDEIQNTYRHHEEKLKNTIEEYQKKFQKLRYEIEKPIKNQKQILNLFNIVNKIYLSNRVNYHNIENIKFFKNQISGLLLNEQNKIQNYLLNVCNKIENNKNQIKSNNSISCKNNEIDQINENNNKLKKTFEEFALIPINNKEKNNPFEALTNLVNPNSIKNKNSLGLIKKDCHLDKNYNYNFIQKFFKVKNEIIRNCTVSNAIDLKQNNLLIALKNKKDKKSKLVLCKIKYTNAISAILTFLSEYSIEESPINYMMKYDSIAGSPNTSILCCSNNFIYKILIRFYEDRNIPEIKQLFKFRSTEVIFPNQRKQIYSSFKICLPINYRIFLTAGNENGLILWRQNEIFFSEERYRYFEQSDYFNKKIAAMERIDSKNIAIFCIPLNNNQNKTGSFILFLEIKDEKLIPKKKINLDIEIKISQNSIIKYDNYLLINYAGEKKGIVLFNIENMTFENNSEIEKINTKISKSKFIFSDLMIDGNNVLHYNSIKLYNGEMIFKEFVIGYKKEGKVKFELKNGIDRFYLPTEQKIMKLIYIHKTYSMKIYGVKTHILFIDENGGIITN